jgi:hypothetical protein
MKLVLVFVTTVIATASPVMAEEYSRNVVPSFKVTENEIVHNYHPGPGNSAVSVQVVGWNCTTSFIQTSEEMRATWYCLTGTHAASIDAECSMKTHVCGHSDMLLATGDKQIAILEVGFQ